MTRTMMSMGALALLLAFSNEARGADNESDDEKQATPPDMPKPPPKKAIGEAGDIVLEDVLGARSHSPFGTVLVPVPQNGIGGLGGGVPGAVGTLGGVTSGPTVSAAWFNYSSTSTGPNDRASVNTTRWSFAPSADVFIARGLSVGGLLGLSRTSTHVPGNTMSFDTNAFAVHPRIGYTIPVSSQVAVWPRVHAGVTAHYTALDKPAAQQYRAALDVPLAIRVSSHLLVDVGPEVAYSVLEVANGGHTQRTFTFAGRGGLSLVF